MSYENYALREGDSLVESYSTGDWQGDLYLLIKDAEGRLGFLQVGYGSCSGCDWYQGVCDDADYDYETNSYRKPEVFDEFEKELQDSVEWFATPMDLKVRLREILRKRETYWYSNDAEFRAWAEKVIESL